MATYQLYLAFIPRIGLLKKHDQVPVNIKVSTETGYFESNTEQYWKLAKIDSTEIIQEINKLVNKATWGNDSSNHNWKNYSEEVDNDAWMSTNGKSGKIEEFHFRADLREKGLVFLREMIQLAEKKNCLLMDIKGNLATPELKEINILIKKSNAYKFLQDPLKFLTEIGKGKID